MEVYEEMYKSVEQMEEEHKKELNKLIYTSMCEAVSDFTENQKQNLKISLDEGNGIIWSLKNNCLDEYINAFTTYNDFQATLYEVLYFLGFGDYQPEFSKRSDVLKTILDLITKCGLFIQSTPDAAMLVSITQKKTAFWINHIPQSLPSYEEDNIPFSIDYSVRNKNNIYNCMLLAKRYKGDVVFGYKFLNEVKSLKAMVETSDCFLDPEINLCLPKELFINANEEGLEDNEQIINFEMLSKLSYEEVFFINELRPDEQTTEEYEEKIKKEIFRRVYVEHKYGSR